MEEQLPGNTLPRRLRQGGAGSWLEPSLSGVHHSAEYAKRAAAQRALRKSPDGPADPQRRDERCRGRHTGRTIQATRRRLFRRDSCPSHPPFAGTSQSPNDSFMRNHKKLFASTSGTLAFRFKSSGFCFVASLNPEGLFAICAVWKRLRHYGTSQVVSLYL